MNEPADPRALWLYRIRLYLIDGMLFLHILTRFIQRHLLVEKCHKVGDELRHGLLRLIDHWLSAPHQFVDHRQLRDALVEGEGTHLTIVDGAEDAPHILVVVAQEPGTREGTAALVALHDLVPIIEPAPLMEFIFVAPGHYIGDEQVFAEEGLHVQEVGKQLGNIDHIHGPAHVLHEVLQ